MNEQIETQLSSAHLSIEGSTVFNEELERLKMALHGHAMQHTLAKDVFLHVDVLLLMAGAQHQHFDTRQRVHCLSESE